MEDISVNTLVEYWYRAPGSTQDEELETQTIDRDPEDALKLVHSPGDTVPLESGRYRVVAVQPRPTEGVENLIRVFVTDA
jgi:hypothetical protein